ncbi:MAG TPA: TonB-dependent receptor plug domain-containing protein, partial [Chitinophagaceae bacterium]|nr:TonB-dependent receptor plug domain-containing protein [Chitinophagaceae bacterium]
MSFQKLIKVASLLVLLFIAHVSYSQNKAITGKVTDSRDGLGLPGVTVTTRGSKTATQTDANGSFSISIAPEIKSLLFSSIGYATQEVSIEGKTSVNISLVLTSTSLNEVVVTGYGTAKRKDLTGSIATITSKDFNKGSITTPEQLIAGKVAGVQITSNGGAPGSGSTIRIRGGASLNASNNPLIVIDGVPIDNNGISGVANPLALINPNDIESFNILKDASATAIYGSRAS